MKVLGKCQLQEALQEKEGGLDSSEMSCSQTEEQNDDTKPLWNYVTKIKNVGGGGNFEIQCKLCDFSFNGSYTRVRAHLLKITGKGVRGCKGVTPQRLVEFKKMDNEAALRIDKSKAKFVSLPPVGETNIGADPKKRKTSSALENGFNMQARETLDFEIARMFYSAGLPFHLARNPYFRRAFSYAANNSIGGYQPPGYNKLRTSLLLNERKHVEKLLEPIKHSWSQNGVTIVSDGWSDPQRRPLINFMAVKESGPMFLKAVDCFNELLSVATTRFASTIVMLKRFRQLKQGLREMVISDQWSSYKEDDVGKATFVKETLLDDVWWDKDDYILAFTSPIYDVLRKTDTDASCLHLVYEMWDSMIEEVKKVIYRNEKKVESEESAFYNVVHTILIDRWTKSSTPLHCLAHSLNPRYYSHEWLSEDSNRVRPHHDLELTRERMKCFKRYFVDAEVRRQVNVEFANFTDGREGFDDIDSLSDRGKMDAKSWWLVHGAHAPILRKVALKLLGQPCSSSCCERNWSTYSFIHSMRRNKMAPYRAEDLVLVHSNLRLLSRNSPQYKQEETKLWDIAGDEFDSLDEFGILEVANLSLDEPELEVMFFNDDQEGGERR
ncbi:Ribonuclease H-like superfamily [Sesbania bispinosa]|nr:Ribonuclease H-like superfamily [Sesbania bispinosa]